MRFWMVVKLVSIPPSQRKLTYGIPDAVRRLSDRGLGLALGADEEDHPAARGQITGELGGALGELQGLTEVDDVDPVALAVDVGAHLGVPTPSLVPEMDASLE